MMNNVFAIVAASLLGLSVFCERGQCQTWAPPYVPVEHLETDLGNPTATGIDLYVKPDKKPDTKPDRKPEVDKRKADAKKYPTLYSEAREKGTIVIFGADWCQWCKAQENVIPDGYRVLYVKVEAKGKRTKWRDLMSQWEVVPTIAGREAKTLPTCVVSVDGVPVDHWFGFKPWRSIEKRVQKAKGEKKNVEVKPTNSDRGGGGRRRYNPTPRSKGGHVPQFGRWSRRR